MALDQFQTKCPPVLEPTFQPTALHLKAIQEQLLDESKSEAAVIALERPDGWISRFETTVFSETSPNKEHNVFWIERLVKFLLWQRGGNTLYIGAPKHLGNRIAQLYCQEGARSFDANFMGQRIFEKPFKVIVCNPSKIPPAQEAPISLGRHLNGCRIGFDLGASDRKVAAVVDGKVIFSDEVIWEPGKQANPDYHYQELLAALKTAASKMPHVDAIGGSCAGVLINNQPRVATLFRSIPVDQFHAIKGLFNRVATEMKVPISVINDGDVTALAGSMSLSQNGLLGIALGSSEATGYVNNQGQITGWLNELAFAPIDESPHASIDEWSSDRGCGARYLSQQCVFRLAKAAGLTLPENATDAEKLIYVQNHLEGGHRGANGIWESMSCFLGYAIAQYAYFYDLQNVLMLGRCTSGKGGKLLLEGAKEVLKTEFPHLAKSITLHLPDEKSRRVGQSIAAASLPCLSRDPI